MRGIANCIQYVAADGKLVYSALCLKPDAKSKQPGFCYVDVDAVELRGINTSNILLPDYSI